MVRSCMGHGKVTVRSWLGHGWVMVRSFWGILRSW